MAQECDKGTPARDKPALLFPAWVWHLPAMVCAPLLSPSDPIQVLAASPYTNKPHCNIHTGISSSSFCFTGKIWFVGLMQNVHQSWPKYCRGMGNKLLNSWSLSWSWITLCSGNKTSFMSLIQTFQKTRKYLKPVSSVFSSWNHLVLKGKSCQYLQLK